MSEKKKLGNIMYKPNPAQKVGDHYAQSTSDGYQQAKKFDIIKGLKKLMQGKEDLTMDKMITSKFKGDQYKSKASPYTKTWKEKMFNHMRFMGKK